MLRSRKEIVSKMVEAPGGKPEQRASMAKGYARAGARAGVILTTHTEVTGIDTAGNRVVGVRTGQGRIACSTVICTAGARSARTGDMTGIDLPVRPVKRQLAFTAPLTPPAPRIPFRTVARHRAPAPAAVPTADGWAGLYEVTPEHNALIGRSEELPGFLYATGFSGHGSLQAPAVGEVVRDPYLEREPRPGISPLSADRFRRGAGTRPEAHVV